MANAFDLPDVNVWHALNVAEHPHHERAHRYWADQSPGRIAFCRPTALGFLRLATSRTVMGGHPLTVPEAWQEYRAFRQLPEVTLLPEPEGCESILADWAEAGLFTARLWTDAYLAAFSLAGGCRLISFDRDFSRFEGLDFLRLEP